MKYWVFVVTKHKGHHSNIRPEEVYAQRMKDLFWGIGEKTPNRKNLSKGDGVVYYLGMPKKVFVGTATLSSSSFQLDSTQKQKYGHGRKFFTSEYGVLVDDINIWSNPRAIEDLVPKLEFIENKEYWFAYFQGGVRQISEKDFNTIIGKRDMSLVEQIASSRDVESQSEFALETHLEEFIHRNWQTINWGSKLELYETEDQDGRQFPAGTWSMDFLAVDRDSNDLVVIELKKGKSSDSTVGQLLRYISWVKENVAEEGQNVRGIIIARDVDEALNYAVKGLKDAQIRTYKVDFQLR